MKRLLLAAITCAFATAPSAQSIHTEFEWGLPTSTDLHRPFAANHYGARTVQGPFDLDGDGLPEIGVSDYTGGARVHILELGAAGWAHVASTPWLDESSTSNNGRVFAAGDMDGDGFGEIVFLSGASLAEDSPYPFGMYVFEAQGDNDFGSAPSAVFDFEPNVPNRWRAEQMHVTDVDGDGLDEVIFGNNGNNANDEWFVIGVVGDIGSGFETFNIEARVNSRTPVNRGGGSPYGIVPADLDGDGIMEIAMMSWNNFNFTNMRATGPNTYELPEAGSIFLKAALGDHVAFFGCFGGDVDRNGDDEVFCPNLQTGAVSVLNYESGENALQVTADNVSLDMIPGLSNLGLAVGDLSGDGWLDLVAGGDPYEAADFNAGTPPAWIRFSSYLGGDVEAPESYSAVQRIEFHSDTRDAFDLVVRDSAGVITEYRENGDLGGEFISKLTFLGDLDGDGRAEVAAGVQGVDDSLYTYSEVFNPADSTYSRSLTAVRPNEHRVFLRIFEAGAAPAGIFRMNLSVTDANSAGANLSLGVALHASNGFDAGLDQFAPPPPPAGAFDARLRNDGNDYLTDLRPPGEQSYRWDLPWQVESGPLTVSWDPASVPPEGRLLFEDPTGGELFSVNMADVSSVEVPGVANPVVITYSLIEEFSVSVGEGWNMLGLPFGDPVLVETVYPNALDGSFFGFQGSYQTPDPAQFELGQGYWLRFPSAGEATHAGIASPAVTISMNSGWNMISGPFCSIPVSGIADPGSILLAGTAFGFGGSYQLVDNLDRGAGYWLRTSAAGDIGLDCSAATKGAAPSGLLSAFSRIDLEDALGHRQSVYLGGRLPRGTSPLAFTAPPTAPTSPFRATFAGERFVAEDQRADIMLSGAAFPVTVSAEGTLSAEVLAGNEVIASVATGPAGTLVIDDPRATRLRLSTGRSAVEVPEVFTLEQNYPNPFNPVTTIRFGLPEPGLVTLEVFDALGRRVTQLLRAEERKAGWHEMSFDARHLTSGTYFYRIQAGVNHSVRRMVLLR